MHAPSLSVVLKFSNDVVAIESILTLDIAIPAVLAAVNCQNVQSVTVREFKFAQ